MPNFGQILGGLGASLGAEGDEYAKIMERKRQQEDAILERQLMQMRMDQANAAFQQQQQELKSQPRIDAGIMQAARASGAPQPAPGGIPGAQFIPSARPAPLPATPFNAAVAPTPSSAFPPPQPRQPPAGPQGQGQQGGGMTIAQAAAFIDENNPHASDHEKREILMGMIPMLNAEDKQRNADILSGVNAELRHAQAERDRALAEGGSVDKAGQRELRNNVAKLGGDPTKMTEDQMWAFIADKNANKPVKLNAGQTRVKETTDVLKQTINDIRTLVKEHPNAVGAYGELNIGLSKAAHYIPGVDFAGDAIPGLHAVSPDDTKAAEMLKQKLTRLTQALGVIGAAGGTGGATFAKQWEKSLGEKDIFQSPETLLDTLMGLESDSSQLIPSSESKGSSSDPNQALVNKYLGGD